MYLVEISMVTPASSVDKVRFTLPEYDGPGHTVLYFTD